MKAEVFNSGSGITASSSTSRELPKCLTHSVHDLYHREDLVYVPGIARHLLSELFEMRIVLEIRSPHRVLVSLYSALGLDHLI